jgi:hypothetical protein
MESPTADRQARARLVLEEIRRREGAEACAIEMDHEVLAGDIAGGGAGGPDDQESIAGEIPATRREEHGMAAVELMGVAIAENGGEIAVEACPFPR